MNLLTPPPPLPRTMFIGLCLYIKTKKPIKNIEFKDNQNKTEKIK